MSHSKCYECKHKCSIPGDAHIACGHPVFAREEDKIKTLLLVYINGERALQSMGITLESHGVQNGWCNFPINFDPNWMYGSCHLHEPKVASIPVSMVE